MSPTAYKTHIRQDINKCKAELFQARENLAFWTRQAQTRTNAIGREAAKSMMEFSRGKIDGQSNRLRALKSLLK